MKILGIMHQKKWIAAVLVMAGLTSLAWAGPPKPAPLVTFPAAKLKELGATLATTDMALIETQVTGRLKQLTTLTYAAAAPEVVRDVVIHPERYTEFVRNMTESTVKKGPQGELLHQYSISYSVYTVDGRHQYVLLPADGAGGAAPVDMSDPDPDGTRHYRWEFLPASGGGTVIALYGYSSIPQDGFIGPFIRAAGTIEYGMALIPQMTLLLAMKTRAEQIAPVKPTLPVGGPGNYHFLVDRGTLALFRAKEGKIADISLVQRTQIPPETLVRVLSEPNNWSRYVPTLKRSTPMGTREGLPAVEFEQAIPLMSWTTTYAYRLEPAAMDLFGVDGDLRTSRLRWDVRPRGNGQTELVLRGFAHYERGSLIIRQLYKLEPFFEYGIDVGLMMVMLQGVRSHAEGLAHTNVP